MLHPLLWVPFTAVAAATQVVRNGAQASLTGKIGTLGATQVRFVYGLPFAALFLAAVLVVAGARVPPFGPASLAWTVTGAICQIVGTAMMLVVMGRRAFGVAYAYIKTEPVIVALLGVALLGDHLPLLAWLAVGMVTAGVLIVSVKPGEYSALFGEGGMIMAGIVSGALFGLSSIAFRGAIEALPEGGFLIRSLSVLVLTLTVQTFLLGGWLALRNRPAFIGSLREWRESLGAGFMGALSSACFFTAFALTPAANVRTLALVELPMAAMLSGRLSGKVLARHEFAGMALVLTGVAVLLGSYAA
ncbi:MAG: EamA/RhaT family transporter [Novosphingobium sp.]|nr:EamA/RhaT family transporter [Novosphingobium sp.]MCB2080641.1 EamA/RhaT family transporter [Novosphingobium sp.]